MVMDKLKTIILFSLVAAALTNNAFAATGASSLSNNGITNPSLGATNYTGNNALVANTAYGNAYVNARHTQMTATPIANPPAAPAPSYFRDTTRGGNNNHDHGSSDHGGRGNGSQNAQNSHSAGGFGTSGDHIGGGRTGGGFHY